MPYPLVRWMFTDTSTSTSYTLEVNPDAGGSPTHQKHFGFESTAAPDGKTLIFEGRDQPQKLEFSGTLLSEAHYTALATWFSKRSQIIITDDLGRQFTVIIESFTPTRVRSALYPWKHTYKITATLTVAAA